jgi:hypothetical protein
MDVRLERTYLMFSKLLPEPILPHGFLKALNSTVEEEQPFKAHRVSKSPNVGAPTPHFRSLLQEKVRQFSCKYCDARELNNSRHMGQQR